MGELDPGEIEEVIRSVIAVEDAIDHRKLRDVIRAEMRAVLKEEVMPKLILHGLKLDQVRAIFRLNHAGSDTDPSHITLDDPGVVAAQATWLELSNARVARLHGREQRAVAMEYLFGWTRPLFRVVGGPFQSGMDRLIGAMLWMAGGLILATVVNDLHVLPALLRALVGTLLRLLQHP